MKNTLLLLLLTALPVLASAQNPAIPRRDAIVEIEMETVKISFRRPLLTKLLEFSLEREGYVRSAHIGKSDFVSLVRGVKFYRKLHPKQ